MKDIQTLIKKAEKKVKATSNKPTYAIEVVKHANTYQYYRAFPGGKRTYIRKEQLPQVQQVLQRSYDIAVYERLQKIERKLKLMMKQEKLFDVDHEYNKLCQGKRDLIEPIKQTGEMYAVEWLAQHPGQQNTYPETTTFITNRGERVKSKSEKILADLFEKHGIPYSYEPAVQLSNGARVYPDFALLNVRERKTIYWEHLGLVDDERYASRNWAKIYEYEKVGIELGNNLIISIESDTMPLNIKQIESRIKRMLL